MRATKVFELKSYVSLPESIFSGLSSRDAFFFIFQETKSPRYAYSNAQFGTKVGRKRKHPPKRIVAPSTAVAPGFVTRARHMRGLLSWQAGQFSCFRVT